jgi:endonuclease/exonuclease/phosphatase family metal-dependent hydrolase
MNKTSRVVFSFASLLILSTCYAGQETANISVAGGSSPVKFMTFNIKANNIMDTFGSWNSRKKLVFQLITEHSPDVLGLQEPLHNQLTDVQQEFGGYACYSAGGSDGKDGGEACPIFYRSSRFTLIDSGTFWFSDSPDKPGAKGWGALVPRFCSWVQLSEKGTNNNFYVYNTHLDSLSQNSRNKSVRMLEKVIAAQKSQAPFVIMGDFNMRLKNPAMAFLLKSGPENQFPVTDAWLSVHPDTPDVSTCRFGGWAGGPQLDHIQVGLNARAITAEVDARKIDGDFPSDHFPVIANVVFPAPAGSVRS